MMQPEGSILAQLQECYDEAIKTSINCYQLVEQGKYRSADMFRVWSIRDQHRHIDMHTDAEIHVKCGNLMRAVKLYNECPYCGGMGSVMGLTQYEWCHHCNCFGEVEVLPSKCERGWGSTKVDFAKCFECRYLRKRYTDLEANLIELSCGCDEA